MKRSISAWPPKMRGEQAAMKEEYPRNATIAVEIGPLDRLIPGNGNDQYRNGNANVACVERLKDQTTLHPIPTAKDRASIVRSYYSTAVGLNLSITFLAFLGRSTSTFDGAIYTSNGQSFA